MDEKKNESDDTDWANDEKKQKHANINYDFYSFLLRPFEYVSVSICLVWIGLDVYMVSWLDGWLNGFVNHAPGKL